MSGRGPYARSTTLVTGAQGFIGSRLAERLLEEEARVVVPRRDVPALSRFRFHGLEERCDVVQADIQDHDAILRVLNEYEVNAVFHLAAQTTVGTANRSPLSTWEANVRGAWNVLEACREARAVGTQLERVVVASSDKAYGAQDELPYREDLPLTPAWPYDVSKACADMISRSYAVTHELPVAVTRFANVYGGGDFNFTRLVPDTAQALVKGERPVVRSDGTPERDYLYIDDAADAYLAIGESLSSDGMSGRAWNAGSGAAVAVIEVVRRLIEISGRDLEPDIRGSGTPHGELDRQHLDSTAIREELGWEPRWDLDRGLAEAYRWYAERLG